MLVHSVLKKSKTALCINIYFDYHVSNYDWKYSLVNIMYRTWYLPIRYHWRTWRKRSLKIWLTLDPSPSDDKDKAANVLSKGHSAGIKANLAAVDIISKIKRLNFKATMKALTTSINIIYGLTSLSWNIQNLPLMAIFSCQKCGHLNLLNPLRAPPSSPHFL